MPRPHRTALVAMFASSVLALPSMARADVTEADAMPQPAFRVDAGFASPVGFIGAVYSKPVSSMTALEGGVGIGLSGVALGVMGKLRLGGPHTRFTPGIGASVALPVSNEVIHAGHEGGDTDMHGPGVVMPWLDIDLVGIEHRSSSGVVVAASAGVTMALRHAHYDIGETGSDIERFSRYPQLRVGVGHTF